MSDTITIEFEIIYTAVYEVCALWTDKYYIIPEVIYAHPPFNFLSYPPRIPTWPESSWSRVSLIRFIDW